MSDSMPEFGQGDSAPVGDEVTEPQVQESTTDDSQQESTGYNPNWKEAFDVLPDEYTRNQVKPVFEKWDENNNKRFTDLQQKYDPYNELIEHNVDMERIKAAFEFQNRVSNQPEEIFKALGAHLGHDMDSFLNALAEEKEFEKPEGEEDNPHLAELRKTQDGMLNYMAQQEAARQEEAQKAQDAQWFEETKSELDTLEEKYGKVDRNRVVREALYIAEQTGKPVNFEEGIRSLAEFSKTAFQKSPSAKAPGVFAGNGELASGRVDTKKMSESDFEKYAIAQIARINGG